MSFANGSMARWRGPSVVLLLAALVAVTTVALITPLKQSPAEANPTEPQASDRQVALVVASLMRREHIARRDFDDEISTRAFVSLMKSLDPMKLYFYQSDFDEFKQKEKEFDDMIKKGDISFMYAVFKRFLERVDERVEFVDRLLKEDFDFTIDESLNTNFDKIPYAKDEREAYDRWRKRLKYDMLMLKTEKVEGDEARDRLRRRYGSFAKRMQQTDSDNLLEMFLTAITSSFDPHTTYMSPSSFENFDIQMKLELIGIGAALQSTDGYTVITKLIPGGPAEKGGQLKPEDRVLSVGQDKEGEMVDVVDMRLEDVVNMIRGKAGTTVRLSVMPLGATEAKTIEIVREKIELSDSEARGEIIEEGKKPDGSPLKIGVIDLPSFYMDMTGARRGVAEFKSTTRDVRKILDDFKSKGVDAVVLDLRRNGGGSLTEAINLTGLFIDNGPVVQVKDPEGKVQHYDDTERGMAWSGPMVVLTSKFSASASEILAGALQDYRRALIVGDQATHGKGTVQTLLEVGPQLFRIPNPPNWGALKITMQQFYRPGGDSTQLRGVLADVVLPSITQHMDVGEGDLDFALEFDRVPKVEHALLDLVTPAIIAELRSRSTGRIEQSSDFAKLQRNIQRYLEQKERKSVPLNEQAFFDSRKEIDADKEEEKLLLEQANGRPVVVRDYYFDEVLAITLDYLKLLQDGKLANRG